MDFTRRSAFVNLALSLVFFGSLWLASVLPAESILRGVAGNVGIAALVGALFQIMRDRSAFERTLWLKRDDQQFTLGVTSHMANAVFDRHIAFCEAYMEQVNDTIRVLFREGPSPAVYEEAGKLYQIRLKHVLWVTEKMSEELEAFEKAVRVIGADSIFIRDTSGIPEYAEQRRAKITRVCNDFAALVPAFRSEDERRAQSEKEKREAAEQNEVTAEKIVVLVRALLDVEMLSDMRRELVRHAHDSLMKSQ